MRRSYFSGINGKIGRRVLTALVFLAWPGRVLMPSPARAVSDTYNWYYDADGYSEALDLAVKGDRPLFVLFSADWCPYCKRLKRDYLERSVVYDFLGDYLRVEIDADRGKKERALLKEYGVTGFPTFRVILPGVSIGADIYTYSGGQGLSREELVELMKKNLVMLYNQKIQSYIGAGKFAKAKSLCEKALGLDPKNTEAGYGLGFSYLNLGRADKDAAMLKEARRILDEVIKNDPEHNPAKAALSQVRESLHALDPKSNTVKALDAASTSSSPVVIFVTAPPKKAPQTPPPRPVVPPRRTIKEIEAELSRIILSVSPKIALSTQAKWPVFDYLGRLCIIVSDDESVDLHFSKGSLLKDARGALIGKSKGPRKLSFDAESGIDEEFIRDLVKQSMTLNENNVEP